MFYRCLSLTCVVFLSAQLVAADEPKSPKAGAPQGESRKPAVENKSANPQRVLISNVFGGGRSAAEWYLERTEAIVKLSDDQKKKITELFAARDKAVREYQSSLEAKSKATSAALSEAVKSKDQERIAREQKAYQDLYAPIQEMMSKTDAAVQNVLTKEQRDKLNDSQVATLVKSMTQGVELSDEQFKKIKEKLGSVSPGGEVGGRKLPEVLEEILTPLQISAIIRQRNKSYLTAQFGAAKLTPEQLSKLDAKIGELTRSHRNLTQVDPAIFKSLQEFISGLLTAEQKEAQRKQSNWVINAGSGTTVVGLAPGASLNPKPTEKPAEHKPQEAGAPNVKVVPGPQGGIQVVIREGVDEPHLTNNPAQAEAVKAQQRMVAELQRMSTALSEQSMHDRVKRQVDLSKQAAKLVKKLDKLDAESKRKRHELWEELEHVEGQLRQTFGSTPNVAPAGQPLGAWQQLPAVQVHNGTPQPGATITWTNAGAEGGGFNAPPGAAVFTSRPGTGPDLLPEIQSLRRKVEELNRQLDKLNERSLK